MRSEELYSLGIEAARQLWRIGEARLALLDDAGPTGGQQAWVRALDESPPSAWSAWEISRQRGKTFAALVWACQRMGLEDSLPAVYLAQTGGNAQAIVGQFFKEVGDTFPEEWNVVHREGDCLQFGNGSELAYFGTDNKQYTRRRGRKARIVLLDEYGFYADPLDVEQVYVPQLQTTGGVGLYLSSPAMSPTHAFNARCDAANAHGRYVHDTFWSNPRINHEEIIRGECERLRLTREELLASTSFRREFLAQRVTEETRAALPAWTRELERELVGNWERPKYWDAYQSLDLGRTGDPHAWLAAWHDPATNTVTIEDELELRSSVVTAKGLADAIKAKEAQLYGASAWNGTLLGAEEWSREFGQLPEWLRAAVSKTAPRQPFLRVGDNDGMVLNTLNAEHGLCVLPTAKHDKAVEIDGLNQLVREHRLRVKPNCVRLLEQMRGTLWNRSRSQWERTDRDHGDLIDCLLYLCRNVRWHRDCRPATNDSAQYMIPDKARPYEQRNATRGLAALKGVF